MDFGFIIYNLITRFVINNSREKWIRLWKSDPLVMQSSVEDAISE